MHGILQEIHPKLTGPQIQVNFPIQIDPPTDADFDRAKQLLRIDLHDSAHYGRNS
jgi:hypothetical protein